MPCLCFPPFFPICCATNSSSAICYFNITLFGSFICFFSLSFLITFPFAVRLPVLSSRCHFISMIRLSGLSVLIGSTVESPEASGLNTHTQSRLLHCYNTYKIQLMLRKRRRRKERTKRTRGGGKIKKIRWRWEERSRLGKRLAVKRQKETGEEEAPEANWIFQTFLKKKHNKKGKTSKVTWERKKDGVTLVSVRRKVAQIHVVFGHFEF